jgi:hypothetical protein
VVLLAVGAYHFVMGNYRFKLGFLMLIAVAASAADFTTSKNTKCKLFVQPSELTLSLNWHGPCQNGFAHGLGVVRYQRGAEVTSVFYGILKEGYWDSGVLDIKKGYVAGRFEKNKSVTSLNSEGVEDRNVILQAFRTAAQAALELSTEFEKQNNKASAKHYKDESEKLAQQMD